MAKSRENSTTTLLGLKGCKAGEVVRGDDRVIVRISVNGWLGRCPYCGSTKLYGHGICDSRYVLHTWTNGTKGYLDIHRQRWKCRNCGHTPTGRSKELVRSCFRLTRQTEAEALWQLKDRNFSQVTRELGVGYGTLRRLTEMEIGEEALGFVQHEDEIHLGIDELSFRYQEMVYNMTEVRAKRVLGILKDDRIAKLN